MKAVVINEFGGPDVLETASIEEPTPGAHEVKIKIHVTGLNPNESYKINGSKDGGKGLDFPYVPGYDAAGLIEELGPEVSELKVGDRVFLAGLTAKRNTGTYAEKVVADADRVHRLPDNCSMMDGAALGIPAFTAYASLFQRAKIRAGEYILIHGASGAVGSLAIQMAKAIGAIVIGTSSTEKGREQILELGADYAMNHLTYENKYELTEYTEGNGPDVVIEMLANVNLEIDTQVIAEYGRIVVVGSRASIEITPRNLMGNEAYITAVNVSHMTKEARNEAFHGIVSFLENEILKPLIGKKFTLDEPVEAHKELMEKPGNGRTVFAIIEE
ncbi:NADPH:quinone reductase [Alkalibacterium kapii]|uniref:Quinone oxidoreductase n=1 Tax=Alkalibacterium kapii TaxID=426704 RepID=A0A511AUC0_9LACT|nr:NADPH:quinone reductase [Alkalibacterium kapii]GEK91800.1 quinone oxidoreductase [Alkalibacterium kapii]